MDFLHTVFSNTLVAFILLVGIVIFVHELGHFLAGKLFGIGIEEFSIGFGPKAISFHRGGTEYRINWLPLGGYVRFFGADLEEEVDPVAKQKSLKHAALYKRAIISFAGPLANFVLSLCIMIPLMWSGIPTQPSVVSVVPNSVAAQSGLQTGDQIVSIDSKKIENWDDLSKKVSSSANQRLSVTLLRDGQNQTLSITPQSESAETLFGESKPVGRIGVTPYFSPPRVVPLAGSFLSAAGFHNGDEIVSLQNEKTPHFHSILKILERVTQSTSDMTLAQNIVKGTLDSVRLQVEVVVPSSPEKKGETITTLRTIDFASPEIKRWATQYTQKPHTTSPWNQTEVSSDLTVKSFLTAQKNTTAAPSPSAWQSCGVGPNTTLRGATGPFAETFFSQSQVYFWLDKIAKDAARKGLTANSSLAVTLKVSDAQGELRTLSCSLPLRAAKDALDRPRLQIDLPLQFAASPVILPVIRIPSTSFAEAFERGSQAVLEQMQLIYQGLKMLLSGGIPISNLGGPIAVASIAHDAAKAGLLAFLMTMSFISVNIGIVNLLPLPALDGGTLLLQAVEAAYGKPLPQNVQLAVQRVGIFVLISLFVLVFYNDILRLLQ